MQTLIRSDRQIIEEQKASEAFIQLSKKENETKILFDIKIEVSQNEKDWILESIHNLRMNAIEAGATMDTTQFIKAGMNIEFIKKVVFGYFNMPIESLDIVTRKTKVVIPKQLCHYWARKLTNESLVTIASIGNMDHASVLNSIKSIECLYNSNWAWGDKNMPSWVFNKIKKVLYFRDIYDDIEKLLKP